MEQNLWKSFVHRLQLTVDNIIHLNSTHYLIVSVSSLVHLFSLYIFYKSDSLGLCYTTLNDSLEL